MSEGTIERPAILTINTDPAKQANPSLRQTVDNKSIHAEGTFRRQNMRDKRHRNCTFHGVMVLAGNLKTGMVIKQNGDLYRVIESATHTGGGQTGRMVHTRVKNLLTGHIREWRFHTEEKLQDVVLERREFEFLYSDEDNLYLMHSETYEQIPFPKGMIGNREKYLLPAMRLQVEYFEGNPIHVLFPQTVDLKVVSSPPGVREHDSSTYKTIALENGMEILAPQFIKEGEYVKVDVESGKYLERSHW